MRYSRPRRSYKSLLRAASVLATHALVLSGCGEPPPTAAKPPSGVRVRSAVVAPQANAITLTGAIAPRVQSDLSFRFAGRIATRTVDVGDHVEAGQVLAALERTEQLASLSSAKAGVASAEATLKQAKATFERQKTLLAQGFTTQPNYDNASQALQAAQSGLSTATATLGTAQDELDNTELRADAAGVVTARNGEAGQVVDVAQAVFSIALDGPRDAVFEVYEALLARPPGDKTVEIALVSNPSVKAVGKVREIAPAVNPSSGTVRVKIAIERTPPEMGLGAPVSGTGRFQPRDVVTLPWTAFFVEGGRPAVWVVDPQTKAAAPRNVEVDSYRTGELLLRSGVEPGDLVVTAGAQLLRPGEVVAPILETASSESGAVR